MSTEQDMDRLAKAELVREKTGVSFEDARAALEASDYDVLDAIVWLERNGKTVAGGTRAASYSTSTAQSPQEETSAAMARAQSTYERATRENGFIKALNRVLDWIKALLKKSVDISFVAERHGRRFFSIPLLLLIILLVMFFWVILPLLLIGVFFDFRYRFEGIGPVTVDVNKMSERVSEGAEALKRDVMGASDDAGAHGAGSSDGVSKADAK